MSAHPHPSLHNSQQVCSRCDGSSAASEYCQKAHACTQQLCAASLPRTWSYNSENRAHSGRHPRKGPSLNIQRCKVKVGNEAVVSGLTRKNLASVCFLSWSCYPALSRPPSVQLHLPSSGTYSLPKPFKLNHKAGSQYLLLSEHELQQT